eukprot:3883810-Prorocentrum_lima.AAC.1
MLWVLDRIPSDTRWCLYNLPPILKGIVDDCRLSQDAADYANELQTTGVTPLPGGSFTAETEV